MESFSLLKYWRGGGAAAIAATMRASTTNPSSTTIAASVLRPSSDAGEDASFDDEEEEDDEGSFFDLEFTAVADVGDGEAAEAKEALAAESDEEDEGQEREFNFAVSSEASGAADGVLRAETFSPSDDLFFKGKLVPLEPSSFVIAAAAASESDPKPQFPVSFLKSATKFRVFTLGLRRKAGTTTLDPNASNGTGGVTATSASATTPAAAASAGSAKQQPQQNKFFVKYKVEEVPIVSLFTRDNSARSSSGVSKPAKPPAESPAAAAPVQSAAAVGAEEKKFAKEVVHKYLSKIKPLYVRVSKRYSERLRLTGPLPPGGTVAVAAEGGEETDAEAEATVAAPPPPSTAGPPSGGMSLPGLKVVRKRLGKSRSASAAVAAAPPAAPSQRRRDDSLLQQQDGIQSAIAHCKRSFTAGDDKGNESPLARSMSDPGDGGKSETSCI